MLRVGVLVGLVLRSAAPFGGVARAPGGGALLRRSAPDSFGDALETTGKLPEDFFDELRAKAVPADVFDDGGGEDAKEPQTIAAATDAQAAALKKMLLRREGGRPEPPQWEENRVAARERAKKASTDVKAEKRAQMLDAQRLFRKKLRTNAPKLQSDSKASLAKVAVGDWFGGVVRSTRPHGAWVSIGSEVDGFIHVKDMSAADFVPDAREALKVGDAVRCCVKSASASPPKLQLSLIDVVVQGTRDTPRKRVADFVADEELLNATVIRMTPFAAFVDVGAQVDGYLHVADIGVLPQMKIGAVREPRAKPEPGLIIPKCWVKSIDVVRSRIRITTIPLEERSALDEDGEKEDDSFPREFDEDAFFRGDIL